MQKHLWPASRIVAQSSPSSAQINDYNTADLAKPKSLLQILSII